jgi:hypothetical protein
MGQAQVKGAPSVYKMVFRAGGSGLPGSLAHEVPIGRALAEYAVQAISYPGNTRLNQEPVISVHQQIFYTMELRHYNGKPGRGRLISNQRKRFVQRGKHENVGAPEVRPDIGLHANEFNPVAKIKFLSLLAIARYQIGFAAHDNQFDPFHAGGSERLHDEG